jgi:hypothetical protein
LRSYTRRRDLFLCSLIPFVHISLEYLPLNWKKVCLWYVLLLAITIRLSMILYATNWTIYNINFNLQDEQCHARFYPLLLDDILGLKMVAKVKWNPTFRSGYVHSYSTEHTLVELVESKVSSIFDFLNLIHILFSFMIYYLSMTTYKHSFYAATLDFSSNVAGIVHMVQVFFVNLILFGYPWTILHSYIY